ncbi:MAG: CHAD domain-containing protein [Bacteroidota bacterium]|nr:CHAD domain-containing protein [Bacteroidota bacterium]
MKVKSELKNNFIARTDAIDALLEKPVQKFTVKDFHQLRVEIKKLKAQFKLINFCSKKFEWKKYFQSFQSVFQQAGKVRELQVEAAALKKYAIYKGLKTYIKNLRKAEQKEMFVFLLLINKDLKSRLERSKKMVLSLIKTINKNDAKGYLNIKRKQIGNLICGKRLRIKDAHELRKQIKELYYNIKSLNFPKQIKLLKETEIFQNMLGKWHDCEVIKQHVNEAMKDKTEMEPSEIKQLKKIKVKLSADCEILFKKINTAIYKERALQNLTSKVF